MRGFLGGYVFGGIYLLSPAFFSKIAAMNGKIQQYYALSSLDQVLVLFYPLLAVAVLLIANRLLNKERSTNEQT